MLLVKLNKLILFQGYLIVELVKNTVLLTVNKLGYVRRRHGAMDEKRSTCIYDRKLTMYLVLQMFHVFFHLPQNGISLGVIEVCVPPCISSTRACAETTLIVKMTHLLRS